MKSSSSENQVYRRFLRVLDNSMAEAEENLVEEDGKGFSCSKGCAHCCHMLVEMTWEEAEEVAAWVRAQKKERRMELLRRIRRAAEERAAFFDRRPHTKRYRLPTRSGIEVPDLVTDKYFYGKSRPCPLLENGACSAYEVRPSACRMHVVSSPPEYCSREYGKNGKGLEVEIPEEVEEVRDRIEAAAEVALPDSRWGEFSIMLWTVLQESKTALQESKTGLQKPQTRG